MTGHTAGRLDGLTSDQRAQLAATLRRRRPRPSGPQRGRGDYDVVVIGGGAAGLTLACQIGQTASGISVLVLEKSEFPAPETTHKVGESTVEIAAQYLSEHLGLRDHLETEQIRKFGLRMFFSDGDNTDIASRVEVGSSIFPPISTYQLDRGRLENELARRAAQLDGITVVPGAGVTQLTTSSTEPHVISYTDATGQHTVTATWIVDATGRGQLLRRSRQVPRSGNGHDANAAWLRIDHPVDVTRWTQDAQWQDRISDGDRALSTNHLMGEGYWVWIIRLATGGTSIGIVADASHHDFAGFNTQEKFQAWLTEHEPQLATELSTHSAQVLDFRVMANYSFDTDQVFDGVEHWCVTGEAGLFLDPLYSPGLDLIAISNNLVCDLLTRSLDGEDVTALAGIHDKLYRTIAEIWLSVYRGQYSLMGHPRIMTSKVIWDTAFYWGVFGTLFLNDKLRDLAHYPSLTADLGRLTAISNRMQQFFREWAALDDEPMPARFVDLYAPLNFMVELHGGMADRPDPADFPARFSQNTRRLEQLAGQLFDAVVDHYAKSRFDTTAISTIQTWQRDPLIRDLIAIHRRTRTSNPLSSSWICLPGPGVAQIAPHTTEGEMTDALDAVPA